MATASNFVLLKPNLKRNKYPPYPINQHYSMKNSFIPLKTHSNFKALCVKTDFSPWDDLKSKKNQFEILAKRLSISFERLRAPAAGAITFGILMAPDFNILYGSLYSVAVMLGLVSLFAITFKGAVDTRNSVYKLQVEVLDLKKSCSLKKDLNCIAETADTSTAEGLQHILTEATFALLRNSYFVTEASCVDEKRSTDTVEKRFKQLVFEESEKYSKLGTSNSGISNEYIVVTILVAAKGVHFYLPCIKYNKHLKESLLKLATIPSSAILLGINEKEYNPTVQEARDDLVDRLTFLFADEVYHPEENISPSSSNMT